MGSLHPTYDTHSTKEAAAKDAARRNKEAKANGSGREYVVKKVQLPGDKLDTYTVLYRETK